MNDVKEYVYASELFKEVIAERQEKAVGFEMAMVQMAEKLMSDVHTLDKVRIFVASFSESKDQLSQWRAYGPTAKGINIGFDLCKLQISESKSSSSVFAPCIYERERQIVMINEWLDAFLIMTRKLYERGLASKKPIPKPFKEIGGMINNDFVSVVGPELVFDLLQNTFDAGRLCALMKHESFSEEKEWRWVISESKSRTTPFPYKRGIRVGSTTLVPYIELPLGSKSGNARIRSVRVGPHPDPDRATDAITDFLLNSNLKDIEVDTSSIPFRNW